MVKTKKVKKSAVSAKKPVSRVSKRAAPVAVAPREDDAVYLLKLVLYLIIGSQWIRITNGDLTFPIPVGLAVGIVFARMDRFQIDRKIEYAILLLSMFIGFWLPIGLELVL